MKRQTIRQSYFMTPSKVLVVHLNRSTIGSFGAQKNACQVYYGKSLVMKKSYMPNWDLNITNNESDVIRYSLTGVVRHSGGHNYGHYYCHVMKGHEWNYISDTTVGKCVSMEYGNEYMLVYALCIS